MSLAALYEAWHLARLHHRIKSPRRRIPGGTLLRCAAALLVPPGLAVLALNSGQPFEVYGWLNQFFQLSLYIGLAAAAVASLAFSSVWGRIQTTSFAALRAPSREMLRLAGLLGNLPAVLALCAGWTAATTLLLPASLRVWIIASVAPLLQFLLGYVDAILQERIRQGWFGRIIWILSWAAAPLLLLALWNPAATLSLADPLHHPLLLICFVAPLFMLIPGPVTEPAVDGKPAGRDVELRSLLKLGGMRPARTRLPKTHPGRRGMAGAMFARISASFRLRLDWHFIPDLVWSLFHSLTIFLGPAFGMIAALAAGSMTGLAAHSLISLDALLAIAAGAAPRIVGLPLSDRLWLLGVDARAQVLANLKVLFWFAALPTVLATAFTVVVTGPSLPGGVILLFIASIYMARAGVMVSRHGSAAFLWLVVLVPLPAIPLGIETIRVLGLAASLLMAFGLTKLVVWFRTATDETEAARWLDHEAVGPVQDI